VSDNGLEFWIVYAVHRLDNFQVIIDGLLLKNGLFYWREMLLIREINVVQKRAFTGEEGTSYL
jgi:hypothetical protein